MKNERHKIEAIATGSCADLTQPVELRVLAIPVTLHNIHYAQLNIHPDAVRTLAMRNLRQVFYARYKPVASGYWT